MRSCRIIKGDNTRGRFDLFCYAFVTMRGNESSGMEIIKRLSEQYPTWKMNVKYDLDRNKRLVPNKMYQNGPMPFQQRPNMHYQPYPPMQRPHFNSYAQSHGQPSASEKIVGSKPCNILVRELWLGGIPEHYDKTYMAQLMSYYGIIEEIEIFPKFAFIKYKQASEATTAF
mgnify:FL=1